MIIVFVGNESVLAEDSSTVLWIQLIYLSGGGRSNVVALISFRYHDKLASDPRNGNYTLYHIHGGPRGRHQMSRSTVLSLTSSS